MADVLFWPGLPYVVAALVVWPARWAVLLLLDGWRTRQAERRNELNALKRIYQGSSQ